MKQQEITQGYRCVPFGEAALLVEAVGNEATANRAVLALAGRIGTAALPGVVAVQPALTSLLVQFDPLQTHHAAVELGVCALFDHGVLANATPARVIKIAARYAGDDGPDLEDVAQYLGLKPDDVIALHTGQPYRVLMLGFAPGFPYIGPLPPALTLPRRATPRPAVPSGSVAIAAGMTGVYPQRLPGGWHLIGRTDAVLFDSHRPLPSLLQAGDYVQFVAVE